MFLLVQFPINHTTFLNFVDKFMPILGTAPLTSNKIDTFDMGKINQFSPLSVCPPLTLALLTGRSIWGILFFSRLNLLASSNKSTFTENNCGGECQRFWRKVKRVATAQPRNVIDSIAPSYGCFSMPNGV